jgi:hypothetical protein
MAYDEGRQRTVLACATGQLDQTWEWDGTNWLRRLPAQSPLPPRADAALAYDVARARVVLFGGQRSGAYLNDTWEWDGTNWSLRAMTGPAGRAGHGLAYDRARARTVLFGGGDFQTTYADTWDWNGTAWTQPFGLQAPSTRWTVLAYDSRRQRTVLYGNGEDTWELAATWPGHAGGGLPIAAINAPRVGQPFCFAFGNPSPGALGFNLVMLALGPPLVTPVALATPPLCAPGFLHLVPGLVVQAPGNPAFPCLGVPPVPGLAGAIVTLQAASLEQGVCFRATDALVVRIQP